MNPQITCLGENSLDWFVRIQNLALSLRRLSGPLASARIVANFVGSVDPRYVEELERLEVVARVVEPMPGGGPANKLRMFEPAPEDDFDFLIALDCDLVVTRDFSAVPPRGAIGLKPVDFDRLKERDWRKLCATAGLDVGVPMLRATSSGRVTPPYFNSGVITLPRSLCPQLRGSWMESYEWLRARLAEDPHLLPRHLHWFSEQLSLALAIRAADLPWEELSPAMNFPTHVGSGRASTAAAEPPYVLHYHGEIDGEGFLVPPSRGAPRQQAERFNAERADYLGIEAPAPSPPSTRRLSRRWVKLKRSAYRGRHRLGTRLHDLFEGESREPKPLRLARR